VRIHIAPIDPSFEVEHAAGAPLQQHDIIEGVASAIGAAASCDARLQHGTMIADIVTLEDLIQTLAQFRWADVSQKSEATAVDPEYRHAMRRGQAGSMQHRAVTTDRYHQVDLRRDTALGDALNFDAEIQATVGIDQYRTPSLLEMRGQGFNGIGDPAVAVVADQGDAFER
jgi:hypothetical protein